MPAIPTHYRNLRVSETASEEEIREAYRRLSKRYHPDHNPDDAEALRIMQLVNKAYEVLSDPEQRRRHDAWIAAKRQAAVGNPLLRQAAARRKQRNIRQFCLVSAIGLLLGLLVLQGIWWLKEPSPARRNPPSAVTLISSPNGSYRRPDKAPNSSDWPYFSDYIAGYPLLAKNGLSIASITNHGGDRMLELQMQQDGGWQSIRTFYMSKQGFFTLYELGAGQYRLFYVDLDSGKNMQTGTWPIQKQNDALVYPDAVIVLPP